MNVYYIKYTDFYQYIQIRRTLLLRC